MDYCAEYVVTRYRLDTQPVVAVSEEKRMCQLLADSYTDAVEKANELILEGNRQLAASERAHLVRVFPLLVCEHCGERLQPMDGNPAELYCITGCQ